MTTIPQQFRETAKKFSRRPALKFKYHGAYISISFKELNHRVEILAKGLKELGIVKGDRAAILSENRSEWVRSDLAILSLGAITVPVHTTVSAQIIKHVLSDSGSRVVFVSNQQQFNKLKLIINDLPDLRFVVYFNLDDTELGVSDKQILSLEELMERGRHDRGELKVDLRGDDVASIIYTSGTTAIPKGVMLTHQNFLVDAKASLLAAPADQHDTLLSFLPLSHVLERTAGYYAPLVCGGSCIAYAESVQNLKKNLQEIKPTILISVPRIFEKVHGGIWDKVKGGSKLKYAIFLWALKQEPKTFKHWLADRLVFKKIRKSLGGRLRFTISGGATLNHKLARFFHRLGILILEGYGLTETSPAVAVNRLDNFKFGTVGPALAGVQLKIDKDKEILVRGETVMKGYYRNPELTREVLDENGWFHTGDLGFLTSDGFLVIIGRKKEMISLSNGKIAWPEQIEITLNNDRLIAQSFVTGDAKSYLTALIIPDWQEVLRILDQLNLDSKEPDQLIREQKLKNLFTERIDKINEQLADWEKIRNFILLPREFSQEKDELTPTLKLRRQIIQKKYQAQIDSLYGA
ncbi:MAG: long-chain fatty acid--CoA ligase [Patescibacteria group bacterium]|jgi:long-chain acyl-CoA synthetase|nr:long-chain fatty acid--CoA ligase [Patescibacteria group bacterium]